MSVTRTVFMFMFSDTDTDRDTGSVKDSEKNILRFGFRISIKVYSDIGIQHNIGLCPLQFGIEGSDFMLSPISFIMDIVLSAHL
jgi:hypothetical protein